MKKSLITLFSLALLIPFIAAADGLEEDWIHIPGGKENIETGWAIFGKPNVSNLAYQKLGLSRNASAFDILGVKVTTPKDQVRNQYKALLLKWHPDKYGNADYAREITQLLTWAYNEIK